MKIDKSIYQGYLWYSDSKEPHVFVDEEFGIEISNDQNPFIIEGQLFDGKNSISIKYVDGEYRVNPHVVKGEDFNNVDVEIKEYHANRIKNVRKLQFLQYWRPEPDKNCEGMEVLQPKELVFVGFKD